MDLEEAAAEEGEEEEYDAGDELEGLGGGVSEILFGHEEYGCRGYESDDCGTEDGEDGCDGVGLAVADHDLADCNHQEEGEPEYAEGGKDGSDDCCPLWVAVVDYCRIAGVGGAVDSYRAWCGFPAL